MQTAKKKHANPLIQWIGPIRNHFWYICRECNQDEEMIKVLRNASHNNYCVHKVYMYIVFVCLGAVGKPNYI